MGGNGWIGSCPRGLGRGAVVGAGDEKRVGVGGRPRFGRGGVGVVEGVWIVMVG